MEYLANAFLKIFTVSAVRYFVIAGLPFLSFYFLLRKYYSKSKIQDKRTNAKRILMEIFHSMLTTVVFTLIAMLVFFSPVRQYTLIYNHVSDYPIWWMFVSFLLTMVVHDTYFYWMHRLLHHKKLFKYTHLVHHQSNNPSPWASYSFHLLEAIAEGAILIILVFLMPLHQLTVVLFTVVGFAINVYGHLGYEIAPKSFRSSWLFKFFNSSVYHNLHHRRFNGNYGLYFRFWDRLMGTEHADYEEQYDQIQQRRFTK